MKIPYIFNIQKFSLHDGPGIRTTVFFKGCPLRCLWCHNPESQDYGPETMRGKKEEPVGRQYPLPELIRKIQADQMFYDQSGGGATFSGGEVMTQDMDYVTVLAEGLQRVGVSVAIDTSGFAPREHFERILPYTDLFLYDLKLLDSEKHREYVGVPNDLILANLQYLGGRKAAIDLRLMLADGVNADEESVEAVIRWLKENDIALQRVSLLAYHDFGRDKYAKLGRECTQNFTKPADETLQRARKQLESSGYAVKIGG